MSDKGRHVLRRPTPARCVLPSNPSTPSWPRGTRPKPTKLGHPSAMPTMISLTMETTPTEPTPTHQAQRASQALELYPRGCPLQGSFACRISLGTAGGGRGYQQSSGVVSVTARDHEEEGWGAYVYTLRKRTWKSGSNGSLSTRLSQRDSRLAAPSWRSEKTRMCLMRTTSFARMRLKGLQTSTSRQTAETIPGKSCERLSGTYL